MSVCVTMDHPSLILVISNVSKTTNIFQLLDYGNAYGFTCLLVGCELAIPDDKLTSHWPTLTYIRYSSLSEVSLYLKGHGIKLTGIEIMEEAVQLQDFPWIERYNRDRNEKNADSPDTCEDASANSSNTASIAIMPGNEGTGLSLQQKTICDDYVFIPQYRATIESLNVSVATSIVLYEAYHVYKRYSEQQGLREC